MAGGASPAGRMSGWWSRRWISADTVSWARFHSSSEARAFLVAPVPVQPEIVAAHVHGRTVGTEGVGRSTVP